MLVALDAGAEDITDAGDHWQVTTPPERPAGRPQPPWKRAG